MQSLGLKFFRDTKVRSENKISIPKPVLTFIKNESSEELVEYRWTYDNRNDTLLISAEGTRHEEISKLKVTIDHHNGKQTKVPEPARNKANIEEGDCLYLWTHNQMAEAGAPSIFVWKLERLEGLMIETMSSMSESELFPNF
jgi:hypothetical protein